MRLSSLVLVALLALPSAASAAQDLGRVTKALRPTLRTFDDKGQPLGQLAGGDLKLPTPIVAIGAGNSIGVNAGGKVVYLRGIDVLTEGLTADCAPVQAAARPAGSTYAATNLGLGGAADCKKPGQ